MYRAEFDESDIATWYNVKLLHFDVIAGLTMNHSRDECASYQKDDFSMQLEEWMTV